MKLDKKAAYSAIKEKCSDKLGLDVVEIALGIVKIANFNDSFRGPTHVPTM